MEGEEDVRGGSQRRSSLRSSHRGVILSDTRLSTTHMDCLRGQLSFFDIFTGIVPVLLQWPN